MGLHIALQDENHTNGDMVRLTFEYLECKMYSKQYLQVFYQQLMICHNSLLDGEVVFVKYYS